MLSDEKLGELESLGCKIEVADVAIPAGLMPAANAKFLVELLKASHDLVAQAKEANRLRESVKSLEEVEKAQYGTICEVAAALGLSQWGNDELGPAVASLRGALEGVLMPFVFKEDGTADREPTLAKLVDAAVGKVLHLRRLHAEAVGRAEKAARLPKH